MPHIVAQKCTQQSVEKRSAVKHSAVRKIALGSQASISFAFDSRDLAPPSQYLHCSSELNAEG
jgi:hypothetical protein